MNKKILSDAQVAAFERDGYILVTSLFDEAEADILRKTAKADAAFQKNTYDLKDGEGGATKLALWNKAGENVYGTVARCPRIVDSMEQLLGDEVYHYHSKMSIKEPFTGGAWSWHQDYGYWYMNGCLYPDMASAFVAVDPNTKENGCLQVLKGSHKMGRVEHGKFGDQTGADPERVEAARQRHGSGLCRNESGRCPLLSLKYIAPFRPEQISEPALVTHLLLQHQAQQSLQAQPSSLLRKIGKGF
ncbi:Phytanoyl-CoA dioxygenase [Pedosphaera parvula Ellin514]|uniref:Phytanoyl-CoA dioxygenase n=1 Tax=Pedosphaera parvula (strain Ellin514) TaxID=320771 RepID=B9XSY3_PEDPL|nr:Phytanoyl-CoA dioxygenase [Pedosphaera parvula Ellin514]